MIETFTQKPSRVLKESVARLISDILSDNVARTPAFGEYSPLHFPGKDVAVKTGTTNDHRDAWTVGYTPEIAVGAWAGNNDNSSMEKKIAGFIITPLWHAFMQEALALLPEERFTKPGEMDTDTLRPIFKGMWQGGEVYTIDTISGKLATEYTPVELREEKVIPDVHSALYWINKLNINGPSPEYPSRDPQFKFWEYGVEEWLKKAGLVFDTVVPTEFDDIHKPEFAPTITIVNPIRNAVHNSNNRISVLLKHQSTYPLSKVDFFINGVFVGSTKKAPFTFSFTPNELENLQAANVLRVVGYDTVQNSGKAETLFAIHP